MRRPGVLVVLAHRQHHATSTAFDASGVVLVTQELLAAGFSDDDVAAIMGGNVERFLLTHLP